MIVLPGETVDAVVFSLPAVEQALHIWEHGSVLIFHVTPDLGDIFVVELDDEKGDVVTSGAVYRLDEPPPDGREHEIEKIGMRLFQV